MEHWPRGDLEYLWTVCMDDHGIEWKRTKQKLHKEIMALTFAKGRDLCGLFFFE